MKCGACDGRTCFQHKVPWHAGLTCSEWDLLQARPGEDDDDGVAVDLKIKRYHDAKASEDTIKQIAKPCPGCARNIEKNGGW